MPTQTKKPKTIPEPIIERPVELVESPKSTEEFVTFKSSHFYSVLVVLAFSVGILVGYVIWGRASTVAVAANPQNPAGQVITPPTEQPQFVRYDIPTEGYPSHGPADAPITIVEFSDYQCPFCSRFHEDTYQALLDAYPGQIRFVYRNLPLDFHQNAQMAAEAALCAGDQNAYWEMHDLLFSKQAALNNQEGLQLDQAAYNQYAQELALDVTAFEKCMTSHKFKQFIDDDMAFSQGMGVRSTPSFFINGLFLEGAVPLVNFQQLIDSELAGEIPQS